MSVVTDENASLDIINEKDKNVGKGWSKEVEVYLYKISEKCLIFRTIHEKSAIFYESRFNYFTLFMIALAFISSSLSIVPITGVYYKYFITIISIGLTSLATINKFLKWQEYSTKHRFGSQKFLELNLNITEEFLTEKPLRTNGIQFIKWAGKTFTQIRKGLPYPPDQIFRNLNIENDPLEEETREANHQQEVAGGSSIINSSESLGEDSAEKGKSSVSFSETQQTYQKLREMKFKNKFST